MGYQNQSGHFVIKKQNAGAGTALASGLADLTGAALFLPSGFAYRIRGGNPGPNRELLVGDPEIGGNRDVTDAYLGAASFTGDIDLYPRMKNVFALFDWVLGNSVAQASTANDYVDWTIMPSTTVPFYMLEQKVSNTFENFRYGDVKCNSLHLEAEANGYLSATIGLIAKYQLVGQTTGDPAAVIDASPMAVGTNITITYNGVTLPAKSFSIDINNNIEDDDFRLGSFYLGDLTEKRLDVTASVTIRPQDSSLWRQAVYGTQAATTPGGVTTKGPIIIEILSYERVFSGNTIPYRLRIYLPRCVIAPLAPSVSGDDVLEHDFEITALSGSSGQDPNFNNLLSANAQNFEGLAASNAPGTAYADNQWVDTSGTPATLTVVNNGALRGTKSLLATLNATTSINLRTVNFYTVDPTKAYTFEGWVVSSAGTTRLAVPIIEWYDSGNALISTTTGSPQGITTAGQFFYTQVTGTPPSNAAKAKVVMQGLNGTSGTAFRFDDMFFGAVDRVIWVEARTGATALP